MITFLAFDEAQKRADENLLVYAFPDADNDDDCEMVNISRDELLVDSYDEDTRFGYDKEAEGEAEKIFNNLREEVKEYLYRFLLTDNNPLFQ